MKQFIFKTIIAVIAIVLVYELTIAKQIKEFEYAFLFDLDGTLVNTDLIYFDVKPQYELIPALLQMKQLQFVL